MTKRHLKGDQDALKANGQALKGGREAIKGDVGALKGDEEAFKCIRWLRSIERNRRMMLIGNGDEALTTDDEARKRH